LDYVVLVVLLGMLVLAMMEFGWLLVLCLLVFGVLVC
jgi:hypothetical protein